MVQGSGAWILMGRDLTQRTCHAGPTMVLVKFATSGSTHRSPESASQSRRTAESFASPSVDVKDVP